MVLLVGPENIYPRGAEAGYDVGNKDSAPGAGQANAACGDCQGWPRRAHGGRPCGHNRQNRVHNLYHMLYQLRGRKISAVWEFNDTYYSRQTIRRGSGGELGLGDTLGGPALSTITLG